MWWWWWCCCWVDVSTVRNDGALYMMYLIWSSRCQFATLWHEKFLHLHLKLIETSEHTHTGVFASGQRHLQFKYIFYERKKFKNYKTKQFSEVFLLHSHHHLRNIRNIYNLLVLWNIYELLTVNQNINIYVLSRKKPLIFEIMVFLWISWRVAGFLGWR